LSYKKTVIRKYFVELLKAGVTSVDNRVYGGRLNPKDDDTYPYLTVYTKDDDVAEQFTSHTSRELQLFIGVIVKDNDIGSGDFDEVIEDIMIDVETIMGKVITVQAKEVDDPFALFNSIVLVSTKTGTNNESSSDIGSGMLGYKIDYDYQLPIVPVTLEDFDVDASIAHIQITNPGVPEND